MLLLVLLALLALLHCPVRTSEETA